MIEMRRVMIIQMLMEERIEVLKVTMIERMVL